MEHILTKDIPVIFCETKANKTLNYYQTDKEDLYTKNKIEKGDKIGRAHV